MKNQASRQFPVVFGLLVLAFGSFLPVSCTKDVFTEVPEDDLVEMIITVGNNTKTANDGDHTNWTEGDQLSVIHSAPNASTFWLSPFTYNPYYGAYAFYGTVSKLSANNDWYAVYPYDAKHVSAESVSLTFPATQVQTGNAGTAHLAGETMPMFGKAENVARSTDLSIQMKNLLSVAEFKVTNSAASPITVREIEFTAPQPVSGAFSVNLTGDAPVLTAGAKATKTIRLTVDEGSPIAVDDASTFNIAIAPFTAPAGSQIKIKVTANCSHLGDTPVYFYQTITLENEARFESGIFKTINVRFDENHSTNPDGASAGEVNLEPGEQPEDGEYLLVYEDGNSSMAFAAFGEYKSQHYAIPVTVVDGVVIPQPGEDLSRFAMTLEVATESDGSPMEHPNDAGHYAYNVRNSEGQYVFYSTGGGNLDAEDALQIKDVNEMEIDGTTYKYYHTFVQAEDGVQILSSISGASGGNKYLLAYTQDKGFYYEENNSGQKLHLYLIGGTVKERQTLEFGAESETWNIGSDYEIGGTYPGLPVSGTYYTEVTYSSSNVGVAEIVPDNGGYKIKINSLGRTTITATAEGTDAYYGASDSYTLLIRDPDAPVQYHNLGTINLENQKVMDFLTAANAQYTDTNYQDLSIVKDYAPATNSGYGGMGGSSSTTTRYDIPNPVTIPFDSPSTTMTKVNIYNDASCTDLFWTWEPNKADLTEYDVYNSIPGRTYYYTVTEEGEIVSRGEFSTTGRRRMMKVSDLAGSGYANNCRDLGGMLTADGTKRVKYGMIYRGTNLNSTTSVEKKLLAEFMNVGWDNDLRATGDLNEAFANSGYSVVHVAPSYNPYLTEAELKNTSKIKQTMEAFIAAADAGKATYFHCTIGSDRTGYWGLLLEGLLGISPKDCSIDYELTSFANHATGGNRERNATGSVYGLFNEGLTFLNGLDNGGTTLEEKITNYMVNEVKVPLEDINRFKSLILESVN
ncbi:MAG: tyrosine-protein phosphatase [Bacteroidales bacterium]|nr:tyrosine-protein phosphatase [Bacteroidales bacterium]